MSTSARRADEYESFYREFDSGLMRQVRAEAYGEDIGQHSWVGTDELREDSHRLGLGPTSRLLDLGSGPCGPLTFLIAYSGCSGVGLELSASAIEVGRSRAAMLNVATRFSAQVADLNVPLPRDLGLFHAVLAIDVVLHLLDREALFREVAAALTPGGRFLVTDAGIITGAISSEEIRVRSVHGYTQFVPAGWNEARLEAAGFRLLDYENRTASVVRNAQGRLRALQNHRHELHQLTGVASFDRQIEYVSTVEALAARGALSRFMYLAEARPRNAG
jgi:cyclopropane fatty-acyl-phospholipid synthase-like methyltransferase